MARFCQFTATSQSSRRPKVNCRRHYVMLLKPTPIMDGSSSAFPETSLFLFFLFIFSFIYFLKSKMKSNPPRPHNPVPLVIIKALSGVSFIHTQWEQTHTHIRTHTIAFYKQTTEQRQKDQHIWLYTIHWLNSTHSINPFIKLGYLGWEYTDGHHFFRPV